MSQSLLNNFNAFKAPWPANYITSKGLEKMAGKPLTGHPSTDQNILLAREIQRRPDLMKALDRDGSTGVLDGRLTRQDINSVVRSDNPLKFQDDKQLVQQMLNNFNELKGGFWSDSIKVGTLKHLSSRPLTGNPTTDSLIQLAREVTTRSDLLGKMDNIVGWKQDGKIKWDELLRLLR
ncbi:hypothetical protein HKK55_06615 [Pseudomonas sp. ADAK18]|uniref:hypothetical protein n=1 Tax=Pseudomonas sp. ADAK18 TaxID=2730848 RepID=UPI001462DD3E|nr:hypothetical protein [Pseudomonas sp. ADAK18]QJI28397.1 hypothetical protein HKK55_06615 [Pseudomonas sp. ADAK18]